MKKLIPLAVILFLDLCGANAQIRKTDSRWDIGLSGGLAEPTGRFKNSSGPNTVFAGAGLGLTFAWRLNRYVAPIIALDAQFNKGDGFQYDPAPGQPYHSSFLAHDWKSLRVLGGARLTIPFSKDGKWAAQLRAAAGMQRTRMADWFYPMIIAGGKQAYAGNSLPWAFSWQIDAAVQRRLSRHIAVLVDIGYSYSIPEWTRTVTVSFPSTGLPNPPTSSFLVTIHYPTGTLHARAGVVYFLP